MKNMTEEQKQAALTDLKERVPASLAMDKSRSMCSSGSLWDGESATSQSMAEHIDQVLKGHGARKSGQSPGTGTTPEGGEVAAKKEPEPADTTPAPETKKVDLPSMKNTAYALQNRELENLAKKMRATLSEGKEAWQSSNFMREAFVRVRVGFAWLGQRVVFDDGEALPAKIETEDIAGADNLVSMKNQQEVMSKLMNNHFPLVSSIPDLVPMACMTSTILSIKGKDTKQDLEKCVQSLRPMKEMAAELQQSVSVSIKDLKKSHIRRT